MSNNNPIKLRLNDYKILLDIADSDGNRKISKGELAKLNSIFNNKNGVEFVDYEQMLQNVMQKTAEQIETNEVIPETAEYFLENEDNSLPLADAIFRELSKEKKGNLPNSNKKLLDLIKQLNSYNIEEIDTYYQNKYGTTIDKALKTASNINPQLVTLMSTQVESCKTNAKKQYTSSQLAELLYEDIKGIGTSKNISEHINAINKNNVIDIMQRYKANNDNKDHKSLISDIMEEYGLDINERIKYVKHIFNSLIEVFKADNIYVDDIVEKFNRELTYQKRTWKPANSERLDCLINQLKDRKEGTWASPQSENIPYNGKIDKDFKQGRTGDCWLVASIKAIAKEPRGLQILNNMIKIKPNGDVAVTLKGVNKTYNFTKQEIEAHTEYATGDLDVRIIEMAVNKYFEEERGVGGRPDINGNHMYIAFNILTGKGNWDHFYGKDSKVDEWINGKITDEQIDNFNNKNHVACVSSHKNGVSTVKAHNTDGSEATVTTNHAYAVSRSDSKYVYLINPWNTSKEIKLDRKTFKEFFNNIDEFDL